MSCESWIMSQWVVSQVFVACHLWLEIDKYHQHNWLFNYRKYTPKNEQVDAMLMKQVAAMLCCTFFHNIVWHCYTRFKINNIIPSCLTIVNNRCSKVIVATCCAAGWEFLTKALRSKFPEVFSYDFRQLRSWLSGCYFKMLQSGYLILMNNLPLIKFMCLGWCIDS